MPTVTIKTSVQDFTRGVEVGITNCVTRVDAKAFPSLTSIRCGMVVQAINGRATPTQKQLLKELTAGQAAEGGGILTLTLSTDTVPGAAGSGGSSLRTGGGEAAGVRATATDEFDISSEEDDDGTTHRQKAVMRKVVEDGTCGHTSGTDTNTSGDDMAVLEAARRVQPGGCIIMLCEGINPALQVEMAATVKGCSVMHINTVARLKTRLSIAEAGITLKKSLEHGVWIYIEHATKSITLLEELARCITELRTRGMLHANARAFLMCEPHPHFPEALLRGCALLQVRATNCKVDVQEEMLESNLRIQLMHGKGASPGATGTLAPLPGTSASSPVGRVPQGKLAEGVPPATLTVLPGDGGATTVSSGDGAEGTAAPVKRRVKISNTVNVVQLETSTFLELSASAAPQQDRVGVGNGDGIILTAKYRFGSKEKLISLCHVSANRYAVGTNNGYVVIVDDNGIPLIQFRPHRACVWDVRFASQYDFSTASEDGTSAVFRHSLADQELSATSVASFQSDVFAVAYVRPNDVSSPVLSGGLSATVCILHSDRLSSSFIPCSTSIQAMCATQDGSVLIGGGDGTCTMVDPAACTVLHASRMHMRKLPAVASFGSTAVTGSFDETVRLWDLRQGFQCISEIGVGAVVTAVAAQENTVTACCGPTLYVWDTRKLQQPLVSKENACGELARGLVLDGTRVITASIDGIARFWELSP